MSLSKNKIFMREYAFRAEMKLYKLNDFLLNDLDFTPDLMSMFEGIDKNGKKGSQYGLFDIGDGSMDSVTLEDTIDRGFTKLNYIFDLKQPRFFILEFIKEEEEDPRTVYPDTLNEKGRNPDQFSEKYEDYVDYQESSQKLKGNIPGIDSEIDDEVTIASDTDIDTDIDPYIDIDEDIEKDINTDTDTE